MQAATEKNGRKSGHFFIVHSYYLLLTISIRGGFTVVYPLLKRRQFAVVVLWVTFWVALRFFVVSATRSFG